MTTLLRLLATFLAAAATLAAAQCTPGTFTDVSGNVMTNCVNGNSHLFCDPTAPTITVYMDGEMATFPDLTNVGGFWFGVSCSGSNAVLLGSSVIVGCQPPVCTHTCPYASGGGDEPRSICKQGNPVKNCPERHLYIGQDAYAKAECDANSVWTMTRDDGTIKVLAETTLEAACSPTACTNPPDLAASDVSASAWLTITSPTIFSKYGISHFSCPSGTVFASFDSSLAIDATMSLLCDAVTNKWKIVTNGVAGTALSVGVKVGCVGAAWPAPTMFDGTEALIEEYASTYTFVKTTVTYSSSASRFVVSCPTGTLLGYEDSGAIIVDIPTTLQCDAGGWKAIDSSDPAGYDMPSTTYGCFATACTETVKYMQESDVYSLVGVSIDTTQRATYYDGYNRFACQEGSQFARMSGTTMNVMDWYMTCDASITGQGWLVKDSYEESTPYSNFSVGCIKPTCSGLLLFDGSEPMVYTQNNYELVPTQPTYTNGRFSLACPAGTAIGYAEAATRLQYWPSMKISCESTGWMVKTSTNTAGSAYVPVKVGCFRDLGALTTPSPVSCPTLQYLTSAMVTSYVGMTVDTTVTQKIVDGKSTLICPAGTSFAYKSGSNVYVYNWFLTCDSGASGWKVNKENGDISDYGAVPVGCVKPSCTGVTVFDGTESVLSDYPVYQYVAASFTYTSSGRFGLSCPSDAAIGYISASGTFTYNSTLQLSCETAGWWVKYYSTDVGAAFSGTKVGCFRKLPNCPALSYITQSTVAATLGVTVVNQTAAAYSSGLNELRCAAGSFFAYKASTAINQRDWYLSCDNAAMNGWRVRDDSGSNTAYGAVPVGCIKPTCTGMQLFVGNETLLASNPSYQLVATTPMWDSDDQRFALVCPADCAIGYAETSSSFVYAPTMKIKCQGSTWTVTTSTNTGSALAPVKVGCFRKIYLPTNNCPSLTFISASVIEGALQSTTVDTTQVVKVVGDLNELRCAANTVYAYISEGTLYSYDWYLTCNSSATNGWRVHNENNIETSFGTVQVACLKAKCAAPSLFDGTEYVLGKNGNYEFAVPTQKMDNNGKFGLSCASGFTLGYQTATSTIDFSSTTSVTCETAGWTAKTTTNTAGSVVTAKYGCFKSTGSVPAVPSQCTTGIYYFDGNEKILRDNSQYAWTGEKALYVNGQYRLTCPPGGAVGFMESPTKFTYAPDMKIFCSATGWMLTTSTNPGTYLSPVKVGCFMPVTCPKTSLLLFDGTESFLSNYPNYIFTGDGLQWKNDKAALTCSNGSSVGFASPATVLNSAPSMQITCESAGWWVRTSDNPTGQGLSPVKVGCFKNAACTGLLRLDSSMVSSGLTLVDTAVETTSGQMMLDCPAGTLFAYYQNSKLNVYNWAMQCTTSGSSGWQVLNKNTSGYNTYGGVPVGCVKSSCTDFPLMTGSEAVLSKYPNYTLGPATQPVFDTTKNQYFFKCPEGYTLGYADSNSIILDSSMNVTCESTGWMVRSPSWPHNLLESQIGCFIVASSNCPSLSRLDSTMLSEGLALDNTAVASVGGQLKLECPAGTSFAYYQNSKLHFYDWSMTCAVSGSNGWQVVSGGSSNGYGGVPVGCVKPSCSAFPLLTGSEAVLSKYPNYTLGPVTQPVVEPTLSQFIYKCPVGYTLGYADTTKLVLETTMNFTCEAGGWMARSNMYPHNLIHPNSIVGCFKVAIPSQCLSIPMFLGNETLISQMVDYAYAPGTIEFNSVYMKYQLTCPPGAATSYSDFGRTVIYRDFSYSMTCEDAGFWIRSAVVPVGHLIESTTYGCFYLQTPTAMPSQCQSGMKFFDGTEPLLRANADYGLYEDWRPTFVNGQWSLNCPDGSVVGYAETETKFTVDASMKITCAATGWWLTTSANPTGTGLSPVKIGCFQPTLSACPKSGIQFITGTETPVTSQTQYKFTGHSLRYWSYKTRMVCDVNSVVGYMPNATSIVFDRSLGVTCQTTGWTKKTESNMDGEALPAGKIGCFKKMW